MMVLRGHRQAARPLASGPSSLTGLQFCSTSSQAQESKQGTKFFYVSVLSCTVEMIIITGNKGDNVCEALYLACYQHQEMPSFESPGVRFPGGGVPIEFIA